jgi:hypothetical protein
MRYAQRVQTAKDYETQFLDQHNVEWRYWEKKLIILKKLKSIQINMQNS